MTAFEHCHSCKPPVRHPGCHSECPHYQVDIAKYNAARDEEQREAHAPKALRLLHRRRRV